MFNWLKSKDERLMEELNERLAAEEQTARWLADLERRRVYFEPVRQFAVDNLLQEYLKKELYSLPIIVEVDADFAPKLHDSQKRIVVGENWSGFEGE